MYNPNYSSVKDIELLKNFIKENSFAMLITSSDENVEVNHFPFMLSEDDNKIVLYAHMAKSNPHWKLIETKKTIIVFSGPHAYISPTYYINPLNVPTWNYTAVHAHCQAQVIQDQKLEIDLMEKMVSYFENQNKTQWNYSLPAEFQNKLFQAIVWVRFEVIKIEGKFKLSQNRDHDDYISVVENLNNKSDNNSREMLRYMKLTKPDFFEK